MSKLNNSIIVFDLETDGLKVEDGIDNINQIAAVAINMATLTMDKDGAFNAYVRPQDIDDEDYYEKHKAAIDLHVKWTKKPLNELMEIWKNGLPEKIALNKFKKWVSDQKGPNPLHFGGQNIRKFDIPILIKRFAENGIKGCPVEYRGEQVSPQRVWDLYDMTHKWFLYSNNYPDRYNMDALRDFFSMGSANAHDALQDVYDEGGLLLRFLKLYKHISPNITWVK